MKHFASDRERRVTDCQSLVLPDTLSHTHRHIHTYIYLDTCTVYYYIYCINAQKNSIMSLLLPQGITLWKPHHSGKSPFPCYFTQWQQQFKTHTHTHIRAHTQLNLHEALKRCEEYDFFLIWCVACLKELMWSGDNRGFGLCHRVTRCDCQQWPT